MKKRKNPINQSYQIDTPNLDAIHWAGFVGRKAQRLSPQEMRKHR